MSATGWPWIVPLLLVAVVFLFVLSHRHSRQQWFKKNIFEVSLADWCMVGLTAVIAIYAASQLSEMHGAGQQTDKLIEAANKNALAATKFSESADRIDARIKLAEQDFQNMANSSRDSIQATQDSMRLDQRAWVTVEVKEIVSESKAHGFVITFTNTGKTPALGVSPPQYVFAAGRESAMSEAEMLRGFALPPKPRLPANTPAEARESVQREWALYAKKPEGYVLSPSASHTLTEQMSVAFTSEPKPQNPTDMLKRLRLKNYIQGRLTYKDVFGKSHETVSCYYENLPSEPIMCDSNNRMD
jgi:hypothetical protein